MMKKWKIWKIIENDAAFTVKIEFIECGERRSFTYPKNNGWEIEIQGVPRFIRDIYRRLEKEYESSLAPDKDLEGARAKWLNKEIKKERLVVKEVPKKATSSTGIAKSKKTK